MSFNNDIFVIGEYINTNKKETTLISLINKLKIFNIPILLSGHYPVNSDIQKLIDFYLFDKSNPILERHEFKNFGYNPSRFWTRTADWEIAIGGISADYAEWSLLRNACNFVKSLNVDNIHYITYDNLPDFDQYEKEFLIPMQMYDASVLQDPNESQRYVSFMFSIKTNIAVDIFNTIQTKEQYYSTNTVEKLFLESVLYRSINERTSNIYLSKYKSNGYDLGLHNNFDNETFTYFLVCNNNKLYLNLHTSDIIKELEIEIEYIGERKKYYLDKSYLITDGEILGRKHNEFIIEIGNYESNEIVKLYYNNIEFGYKQLNLDYDTYSKYYEIKFFK